MVKTLIVMQEDPGLIPGSEVPLEEEMAAHSSLLPWRTPGTERSLVSYSPWGRKELDMTE